MGTLTKEITVENPFPIDSMPKIAIIGAGIAGLAAARRLAKNGFDYRRIYIFEAADHVGGRIHTIPFGDGFIEKGAQWIHGKQGNELFRFANERNLTADCDNVDDYRCGVEGAGSFCDENGDLLNCDALQEMIAFLDRCKEFNENVDNVHFWQNNVNMYDHFKTQFDRFVSERHSELSPPIIDLLRDAFRWYCIFETIDNCAEDDMKQISPLSYIEWHECDSDLEGDLINLRDGYRSVVSAIVSEIPNFNDQIKLRTAVTKIVPVPVSKHFQIALHTVKLPSCAESDVYLFDHVIITSSLGFLKENLENDFFAFRLPPKKVSVIRSLGFGTINKIFLLFDEPFWFEDEDGFQILWKSVRDTHCYDHENCGDGQKKGMQQKFPSWVYCISGFDAVRAQPNMLLVWIGSYGAKLMELEDDETIRRTLGEVLRCIVPRCRRRSTSSKIADPTRVFVTRWNSDPYIRGSYSNRTVAYERLPSYANISTDNDHDESGHRRNCQDREDYNVDILAQPIRVADLTNQFNAKFGDNDDRPVILFAGEATDRHRYSTTDGAFNSGEREANNLFAYYCCGRRKNSIADFSMKD